MQFKLAAFLLLAVPSIFAAPVAEPEAAIQDVSSAIEDPYAELIERQLGGGPSGSPAGYVQAHLRITDLQLTL